MDWTLDTLAIKLKDEHDDFDDYDNDHHEDGHLDVKDQSDEDGECFK